MLKLYTTWRYQIEFSLRHAVASSLALLDCDHDWSSLDLHMRPVLVSLSRSVAGSGEDGQDKPSELISRFAVCGIATGTICLEQVELLRPRLVFCCSTRTVRPKRTALMAKEKKAKEKEKERGKEKEAGWVRVGQQGAGWVGYL